MSEEREITPFRAEREALGLTQPQVAELFGVSQSAVSLWERGRRKGSPEQQASLVARLRRAVEAAQLEAEPADAGRAHESALEPGVTSWTVETDAAPGDEEAIG